MLVIVIPALWLLFLYINSRMRFVLFDSVIAKNCSIRRMWSARGGPAFQYFLWQILFTVVAFAGSVIIIGIPALLAYLGGWFSHPREHIAGFILGGLFLLLLFGAYFVAVVTVHVFTKDFVVPQMALEGISAFEGWRRLIPMLQGEKGGYAGYAGMKIVLALGTAFAVTIAAVIVFLVLLIPFGGVGLVSVLLAKGADLSWNVFTVTAVVVAGCVFLFLLFYVISLISVPVIVFFPAYAIYFFASRYQQLANVIYPSVALPATPITPPPEPA